MKYKNPVPSVDIIIEKGRKILLMRRAIPPFIGRLAIPGGKVEYGETVESAAWREAKEETGLIVKLKEILGVYSERGRDPRYHSISIAFVATANKGKHKRDRESSELFWLSTKELAKKLRTEKFTFDHAKILSDYLKWKRKKGTYWSGKN